MATTKIYCCTSSSSPRAFVGRHRRITALFFEKTTTTTTKRNNATRRRRRQQDSQTTLLAAAAKDDNESSYKQQQEWPEPNLWAESHPRYLVSDWDDDDNKEWGEELCAELDDEEDKVEKLFSSAAASVSRKQERKEELAAREGQGNDRQRTQIEASRVSSSSSSSSSSSLSYSTSTTKSAIRAPKRPNSEDLSNKMSREDFWNEIRKEAEVEAAKEPMLSSFYFTSILSHDCLEKSLSFALANRLCTKTLLSTQLIEIFNEVLLAKDSEQLRNNIRRDLVAVLSRDPACNSYVQALLLFKGFHAIQATGFNIICGKKDKRRTRACYNRGSRKRWELTCTRLQNLAEVF